MNGLPQCRRAGVLLHPSSLPGESYCGTLGAEAYRFADLLADAGLQIWQVLPLGPTHPDLCPYQTISVHAGNPDLIDLDWLVAHGLLTLEQVGEGGATPKAKRCLLSTASNVFFDQLAGSVVTPMARAYQLFLQQSAHWLQDYVRFQAFREDLGLAPWANWPPGLCDYDTRACDQHASKLVTQIRGLQFAQFIFYQQWSELRRYSSERGIILFGDMPFYVHLESADVWAHQLLFNLNDSGHPITVSGVPPDYYSADGQLWGNPQYNWAAMEETGFQWWLQRFDSCSRLFDMVRIDHFRALQAYWEVDARADTAREGRWVSTPGDALLTAVRKQYPSLDLVAENLGTITPEVEELRRKFSLPGMVILQFAFDGNPDNPYLSHMHSQNDVVYTGTHDNNTTLGWFEGLDEHTRAAVYRYFNNPAQDMPWMLIGAAMASLANTAIVPWQDYLALNGEHRMNTPGIKKGNWRWRFRWDQVLINLTGRIHKLLDQCHRLPTINHAGATELELPRKR